MKTIATILILISFSSSAQACGLGGLLGAMGARSMGARASSYSMMQYSASHSAPMMITAQPIRERVIIREESRRSESATESRIDELLDEIQSLKDSFSRRMESRKPDPDYGDDLEIYSTSQTATVHKPATIRPVRWRISQARLEKRNR